MFFAILEDMQPKIDWGLYYQQRHQSPEKKCLFRTDKDSEGMIISRGRKTYIQVWVANSCTFPFANSCTKVAPRNLLFSFPKKNAYFKRPHSAFPLLPGERPKKKHHPATIPRLDSSDVEDQSYQPQVERTDWEKWQRSSFRRGRSRKNAVWK